MKTTLAHANALLRAKQYAEALALYECALQERPALANIIEFNVHFAKKRLESFGEQQQGVAGEGLDLSIGQIPGDDHNSTWLLNSGDAVYSTVASHQIARNSVDPVLWESLGDDPYFLFRPEDLFSSAGGWYELKIRISSAKRITTAKLYLDHGSGFNEHDTVVVPCPRAQLASRVFRIDQLPVAVRLDPKEARGEFRLEYLHVEPLSEDRACERMLLTLATQVEEFSTMDAQGAWETIVSQAGNQGIDSLMHLLEQYGRTFSATPESIAYDAWIEDIERPSLPAPESVKLTLASLDVRPLISIVMPAYNTPETFLRACIESVMHQSYPHWELCIADDNSPKMHVRRVLQEYQQQDSRIRVVYRPENGHISRASNSALEIANGDFVALLDHDDLLPEHALYFMVLAINEHPDAMVLYSDEDKIDIRGHRFSPHFKSDWNPDLFFSQNYVSHLGVYRRELLEKIGGFRAGVEGSQDQDLMLRCLPYATSDEIIHVPRVLYHWRTVEGSTALDAGEKSYTTEAGIKALSDYFWHNGPKGVAVTAGVLPNTYRVRWPIPTPAPLVSLLIPTRDKKSLTEVAVCSILDKTNYSEFEIIILDNGSVEKETLDWFEYIQREDSRVRVIRYDHPFNYSAINNYGVQNAQGSVIGLINNDVEVISGDWLGEMVSHVCRADIGCVGAKLYYGNDTLQHGGVILGIGGVANHSHKHAPRKSPGYFARLCAIQNLSAVTAACLLVRREVYEAVGGLDEENLKVAFNDVDFCLKVREAGYRNLWTPYAELYHHESVSRGHEDTPEKQERFRKEVEFMGVKWGDALEFDPYYNPNLTRDREDFSIKG